MQHSRLLEPRSVEGAEALHLVVPAGSCSPRGRRGTTPHPSPVFQHFHTFVVRVPLVFGALELRKGRMTGVGALCNYGRFCSADGRLLQPRSGLGIEAALSSDNAILKLTLFFYKHKRC